MTDGQAIILYFAIFPILAFSLFLIVDYIIDTLKQNKKQICAYRQAYRRQAEEFERIEFLLRGVR